MRTLTREGQLVMEAQAVLLMLLIPLSFGLWLWGMQEFKTARCAYESFFHARHQLILTQQDVNRTYSCDQHTERVSLSTLEHLDLTEGSGVSLSDWASEVTQLSEAFSSLSQSSPEPDSR